MKIEENLKNLIKEGLKSLSVQAESIVLKGKKYSNFVSKSRIENDLFEFSEESRGVLLIKEKDSVTSKEYGEISKHISMKNRIYTFRETSDFFNVNGKEINGNYIWVKST